MKIAVISTMGGSPWGGSEELWATMVREAIDAGHAVTVSVYEWPTVPARIAELERAGARVMRRPLPRRGSRYDRLLRRVLPETRDPYRELLEAAPDVVFLNQGAMYDVPDDHPALARGLSAAGIPYVAMCHFNSDALQPNDALRAAAGEFFERACRVVFVSHQNQELAERQLARAIPNAVVLRNPVNLAHLEPVSWPADGPARLAIVGRLDVQHKGHDLLLDCLRAEAWREREWRLRVYGDGQDLGYLQSLAEFGGISDRVQFLGHVGDVRSIWAENHLLVLPSRAEGMPLVVVEAMLCGRPCVVTDVGGNVEWIEEGQAGFIAAAPTRPAFSAALEKAWAERANWHQLGMQAHEEAMRRFDRRPGLTLLRVLEEAARAASRAKDGLATDRMPVVAR
jgi:glycosyltransferase involved in cell wall biosynthesis